MKYKIDIMGRDECILFSNKELTENCIIISVNDTGYDTKFNKNEKIIDIHKTWFDDIEKVINPELKLMTICQAKDIKNFVDKYKNKVNHIVVNCTAGISRSSSIACVLARYLNDDDNYIWATGRYLPNKHVYETMCNVFNLEYSDELFKDKKKLGEKKEKEFDLKFYNDFGININDMFHLNKNVKRNQRKL